MQVILMVHGGGWAFGNEDSPGVVKNKTAHLMPKGYAVVSPNDRMRSGHSGNAYGLLSGLWIDRERGNGVANDSSGEHSAFSAVEEQGAVGW